MKTGFLFLIVILVLDAVFILIAGTKVKNRVPQNISSKWMIVIFLNVFLLLAYMIFHLMDSGYF